MDFTKFENWKGFHATEMQDLTFAKSDDFFIYTRLEDSATQGLKGEQVLFAETFDEAVSYIRHIFLHDILIDAIDDLEKDFDSCSACRQNDVLLLLSYWFKLGKILKKGDIKSLFNDFCFCFNSDFSQQKGVKYEFCILNGTNKLCSFLISKYSRYENFDKQKLYAICNPKSFKGVALKDFLDAISVSNYCM